MKLNAYSETYYIIFSHNWSKFVYIRDLLNVISTTLCNFNRVDKNLHSYESNYKARDGTVWYSQYVVQTKENRSRFALRYDVTPKLQEVKSTSDIISTEFSFLGFILLGSPQWHEQANVSPRDQRGPLFPTVSNCLEYVDNLNNFCPLSPNVSEGLFCPSGRHFCPRDKLTFGDMLAKSLRFWWEWRQDHFVAVTN
jgi:hypothetical protein